MEWVQLQQGQVALGLVVVLVGWVPELGLDLQGLDLDSDPDSDLDSDLQDYVHLD